MKYILLKIRNYKCFYVNVTEICKVIIFNDLKKLFYSFFNVNY
jgi:hypothetical protein